MPSPAQNATVLRACSRSSSTAICGKKVALPSRKGPVTSMCGPGIWKVSILRRMFRSVYGSMLPVVRMVVTPAARYRRGALNASSVTKKPGWGILSSSSRLIDAVYIRWLCMPTRPGMTLRPSSWITWAPEGGGVAASVIASMRPLRTTMVRFSCAAAPVPSITRTLASAISGWSNLMNLRTSADGAWASAPLQMNHARKTSLPPGRIASPHCWSGMLP